MENSRGEHDWPPIPWIPPFFWSTKGPFLGSHCSLFFSRSIWEFLTMGNCSKSHKNPYGSHTKVNNINNLDELSGSLILRKPRTWIPSQFMSISWTKLTISIRPGVFQLPVESHAKVARVPQVPDFTAWTAWDVFVATRVGQVQQWTHKIAMFLMFSGHVESWFGPRCASSMSLVSFTSTVACSLLMEHPVNCPGSEFAPRSEEQLRSVAVE